MDAIVDSIYKWDFFYIKIGETEISKRSDEMNHNGK